MAEYIDKHDPRPPREWWVRWSPLKRVWIAFDKAPEAKDAIRVIEKSAFDRLLVEATKLEMQLQGNSNYERGKVLRDYRKCLRFELGL